TPDGTTIIASMSKPMREWYFGQIDAQTLNLIRRVFVPADTQHMELAFDGKSALSSIATGKAPFESKLVAYDLERNELRVLRTPTLPQGAKAFWMIAADPTGPRVVLLHEEHIIIWDYEQGQIAQEFKPEGWTKSMTSVGAAFSIDGRRLFVTADKFNTQE